jgi:conjugative transfer signal peptidase TraF
MTRPLIFSLIVLFCLPLLISLYFIEPERKNPLIIINETPSVKKGLYLRQKTISLDKQSLIAMKLHKPAHDYLVKTMGYDEDIFLLKRISALPGERVCRSQSGLITIKDKSLKARSHDHLGHKLPSWQGCHVLKKGEIFILGDHPQSFDSRYFGPVRTSQLTGSYKELITW